MEDRDAFRVGGVDVASEQGNRLPGGMGRAHHQSSASSTSSAVFFSPQGEEEGEGEREEAEDASKAPLPSSM
jgi:hypothetical protein